MVPEISDNDYAALKVLNSLLGEGMTSRLFTEVREKESLVYQIGSFYPSLKQKSHFVIYAATTPKNLKKVKAEILAVLEKIKKEPISNDELEHYKSHLIGTFLTAHQAIARQAWYLGWYETIGAGYQFDRKYLELVSKVSSADVQRVAQKYFDKYVLVVSGP
jgi:predicted Zn-dependent peptidase